MNPRNHSFVGVWAHCLGYQLIACLLVTLLAAVMAIRMVPRWQADWRLHQLNVATDRLQAELYWARQLAMVQGRRIMVCRVDAAQHCQPHMTGIVATLSIHPHRLLHRFRLPPVLRSDWTGSGVLAAGIQFKADGMTPGQQGQVQISLRAHPRCNMTLILIQSGRVRRTQQC